MIKKMYKDGYDFFFWNYEEQTKIKHFVFQEYFDRWVKIVGSKNDLNFIDGFGGCGAYIENDNIYYGSPILASEVIEDNNHLDRNVRVIIIEKERENIINLQKIFNSRGININPIYIEGDFDKRINDILDQEQLTPTFFFIDPFGFKIKYKTLERIISVPKSEIFLNFMFNSLNQYLSAKKVKGTVNDLFGCNDWEEFDNLSGLQREEGIVDLFRTQLKKIVKYVFYFRMSFPNKARTYYYLFHLTNHYKGCSIMKSCFAKFNNGYVEYRGPYQNKITFFDLQQVKIGEIKQHLIKRYKGENKTFKQIIIEIIDSVPYLEKTIRKTLKKMEDEDIIIINRNPKFTSTGRKKTGLSDRDLIIFRRE